MTIKVFVRQPLTESTPREQKIVQVALDGIFTPPRSNGSTLECLTGHTAFDKDSFKQAFAQKTGEFTPKKFRDTRLSLLNQADVMLIIRTGLSESGAFEVAYNIFGGQNVPMLFAIWVEAEIRTTLLRELDDRAKVRYIRFSDPTEVAKEFDRFLEEVVVPDMGERRAAR